MNYRKRLSTAVLAFGLSGLVIGCAPGGGTETDDGETSDTRMVLIAGSGGPYYEALSCGARSAASAEGVALDVQFPTAWDPVESTSLINAAAATNPDALIAVPTDQSILVAPIQSAVNAGIPVITADQEMAESEGELISAAVATDNYEAGAVAADEMARVIGEEGQVLVDGATPGSSAADERTAGFIDRIDEAYPDIVLLETQYSDSDPAQATQIVNGALASNPDLVGVYVVYQDGVIGAGTALRASERAGEVALIGFDTAPAEIELLEEGIATALIAQQPAQMGSDAVMQALEVTSGGEPNEATVTPTIVVTADNLADEDVARVVNASESNC